MTSLLHHNYSLSVMVPDIVKCHQDKTTNGIIMKLQTICSTYFLNLAL